MVTNCLDTHCDNIFQSQSVHSHQMHSTIQVSSLSYLNNSMVSVTVNLSNWFFRISCHATNRITISCFSNSIRMVEASPLASAFSCSSICHQYRYILLGAMLVQHPNGLTTMYLKKHLTTGMCFSVSWCLHQWLLEIKTQLLNYTRQSSCATFNRVHSDEVRRISMQGTTSANSWHFVGFSTTVFFRHAGSCMNDCNRDWNFVCLEKI